MNLPHLPKNPILRFLMWALGFRKGLSVNRFGCRFVMKVERPAFATWLQAELTDHPPHILVPGHGPAIREAELLSRLPEIIARELGDPKKHPPADDRS